MTLKWTKNISSGRSVLKKQPGLHHGLMTTWGLQRIHQSQRRDGEEDTHSQWGGSFRSLPAFKPIGARVEETVRNAESAEHKLQQWLAIEDYLKKLQMYIDDCRSEKS